MRNLSRSRCHCFQVRVRTPCPCYAALRRLSRAWASAYVLRVKGRRSWVINAHMGYSWVIAHGLLRVEGATLHKLTSTNNPHLVFLALRARARASPSTPVNHTVFASQSVIIRGIAAKRRTRTRRGPISYASHQHSRTPTSAAAARGAPLQARVHTPIVCGTKTPLTHSFYIHTWRQARLPPTLRGLLLL